VASRLSTAVTTLAAAKTRASRETGRHPGAGGLEQPVAIAEIRQHEHRRQKPNRRGKASRLDTSLAQRQDSEQQEQAGGWNGDGGFGQSSGADDGASERRNEEEHCQGLSDGTRHVVESVRPQYHQTAGRLTGATRRR
jgi:hypothetical protein